MSYKKTIKEIEFELKEIESLFDLYRKELLELNQEPSLIELTAMASVLHSFYCGVEKIFLIIAKKIDKDVPYDINWHKMLVLQMAKENESRQAVISERTKDDLSEYLIFRHFYRHSYSFQLKWTEMKDLVTNIQKVWEKFRSETISFIKALESKSDK